MADPSNTEVTCGFGGGIYSVDSTTFSLSSSLFDGINHCKTGGAITLSTTSTNKASSIPSSPSHTITSTNFTSNMAYIGGAIYISDVDYVQITSSIFYDNQAVQTDSVASSGYGGAISFVATDEISKVELDSTVTFENNVADEAGGAIYWSYNEPESIDQPTFTNNTAGKYGGDKA